MKEELATLKRPKGKAELFLESLDGYARERFNRTDLADNPARDTYNRLLSEDESKL
jgi:hypothetical protein